MLGNDELNEYFGRIGYDGPREPALAALRAIVAAHATAIPFENFDPLLGRPVRLEPAALLDKLVRQRRGGYCFEHNLLLWNALLTLGFTAQGLAARVLWGRRPEDGLGPRTHMLLRVAMPEGALLADVGFGGLTLTAPLRLEAGPQQETPLEPHRLVNDDGEFLLEAALDGAWTPLYRFALTPQLPIDYEVANWFTATYPTSIFTNNLMMARPDRDRRYALLNRNLTIRPRRREPERRELANAAELGEVLRSCFRLDLPDADVAAAWKRIAATP